MSTPSPERKKEELLNVVKAWASPILLSIIGVLIWRDVSELRSDVKALLNNQATIQVRVDNMNKDIDFLKSYIMPSVRTPTSGTSIHGTSIPNRNSDDSKPKQFPSSSTLASLRQDEPLIKKEKRIRL